MNELSIILFFVACPLAVVLTYIFIRAATGSLNRKKQLHLQNLILLHIAKKLEVDSEIVQDLDIKNNELAE